MTSGRVEGRKEWKSISISISISNIRYLLSEGQVRHSKLMITGCPESKFSDAFRRLQSHTSALKSRLPRIIVSRCHPICLTKIEQLCLPAHSCHGHDDGTALRCAAHVHSSAVPVWYCISYFVATIMPEQSCCSLLLPTGLLRRPCASFPIST